MARQQADATAAALAEELRTPRHRVQPARLRQRDCRAVGTALERGTAIEPRIAEIPSPMDSLAERSMWLRGVMAEGLVYSPTSLFALLDASAKRGAGGRG